MIEVLLRFAYAIVVLLIMFGLLAGAIYCFKRAFQVKTYRLPKSWVPDPDPRDLLDPPAWICSCNTGHSFMSEACTKCGEVAPWIPGGHHV